MPNHDNVISDGIFDENLDCMEKLNPNYYLMTYGLSYGIDIGRIAAFLLLKKCTETGAYEWDRQTDTRT